MTGSRTPLGLCSPVPELRGRLDRGRFLLPLIKFKILETNLRGIKYKNGFSFD